MQKQKERKKALPGDDDGVGGDGDESDGFSENVILSLALVFFCYGLSFPLVFFLFSFFLLPFSFGLSSPPFFSSPELSIYRGRAWSSLCARLAFG